MRLILFLYMLISSSISQAGIINTLPKIPEEESRELAVATKLSGSVDWQEGNNNKLDLKVAGYLSLLQNPWSVYFVTSATRAVSDSELESLDTMNHLRVRYFILKDLAFEVFVQHEFDEFRRLDARSLVGGGPALTILSSKYVDIMLGTAGMFEHIKPSDDLSEEFNARWSNYIQIEIDINQKFSIQNVFFYQMRLGASEDYMLHESISLEIKATDWFGVSLGFTVGHDEMPLPGVEKTDLALTSSFFIEHE